MSSPFLVFSVLFITKRESLGLIGRQYREAVPNSLDFATIL